MKQVKLEAQKREKRGKETNKKIRKRGIVPAVLYGKDSPSMPLQVIERELKKAITSGAGYNVVIELKINGNGENSHLVMVSEVQKDPLGSQIHHVDFHRISLDKKVTATVPLHFTGEPAGVKKGGNLEHIVWSIEVETLPLNIPEHISINIAHMDIDDSLFIKDINPPQGVTILDDAEELVAIIHPPRSAEATEEAAPIGAPSAVQPEVIKKGKEEKEK